MAILLAAWLFTRALFIAAAGVSRLTRSSTSLPRDVVCTVCGETQSDYLNFDFAFVAVGVTPFLLLFVARFKKVGKKATREVRKRQSDIVALVQQRLESVRSVKAFGRQDLEEGRLQEASLEIFYALQLTPTLRLQPDLQIVWNPAFNPNAGPAMVFQLQLNLAW